jgi:anaerobic dimethyl sulfoxide reductase subunit A
MAGLLEKIEKSSIDRRQFIGLAATAGVVTSLGLTGCDNKVTGTETKPDSPTVDKLTGGEWMTFVCPQDSCAWACLNQAYVVDGIIKRQRTDEIHPDSIDSPQQRGCLKGRSVRKLITGAERLKYPMKRKNWQPGGGDNINGQLRGVDEWERISWDEAITYIADEYTRIRDTYGNRAFLATGQDEYKMVGGKVGSQILNLMGGCLTTFGQQSQGGAPVPSNFMIGHWNNGGTDSQDRMGLRKTKLMVLWGFNTAWSVGTGEMYSFLNAKKISGAKVILIDPFFNPTAQTLVDEWIPIRPSTDGAMLEAIAYEIIQNNWQDQDFLDRCTVGFDADHMPADAKTNENFKDYILGIYDNQPKTPEWASPICGVAPDVIRNLAKEMATTKPMAFKSNISVVRTYYGNRYTQLFFTIGWMCGSIGVPGAETSLSQGTFGSIDGASLVSRGRSSYKAIKNPLCTEPRGNGELTGGKFDPSHEYGIAFAEWHKAIVTGEYSLPGPAQEKRACDIKAIVRESARNPSNQQSGGYWFEEAYRKVELVVSADYYLTIDTQYSDIVLPAKSYMEIDFAYASRTASDFCNVQAKKVIEPYFEAKDDVEMFFLLCDKLGFGEDVAPRMTTSQAMFEMLATTTIVKADGRERENFVSITDEDLTLYGMKGEPQDGRMPIQEFLKTGAYLVPRSENDDLVNCYLKEYREDPEANPLPTTSGKLEIYCQALKDYYDYAMFNDIDALPKYKPMVDGYEQIATDPEYNFQLVTPHHLRQAHSMYSQLKQVNEVFPNDLMMNSYDAQMLGYKRGDWLVASSKEGGKMARRLNPVPFVAPGVLLIADGNWREIDQETGIDIGGNPNTVTRCQLLGDGYQAYNTVLLKVEKYTGKELLPDYKKPPLVPLKD